MGKYIFGPVPSRRLGISLGVDLVKAKTCNLDCVFCECGATPTWTIQRGVFVPFEEVVEELDQTLREVRPDYITFSGSGEPTLSLDLERVIDYIRGHYDVKIAVITNAALLFQPAVLQAVKKADLVMPSLHTVKQEVFERMARPFPECKVEKILQGILALSSTFRGDIDLELFLIEGVNTSWDDLHQYADFVKGISYRKLQLNSLDRFGAEKWVQPLSKERLQEIQTFLEKEGVKGVEIIEKFSSEEKLNMDEERVRSMQERRKYTDEEIKSLYK